jgi:putative ABC transport system substrate-binding protein
MKALAALFAALALSAAAHAQSGKVYRIGILETRSASANRANLDSFLRGLKESGYSEGRNLVIDYRSAEGRSDRFAELARDLVRARPDVIVTRGTPAALAARDAGSLPVVMVSIADPVGTKVVASLARPGGRVTGLATIVSEVHGKRLELIRELLPSVKRIGYFHNTGNPNSEKQWQEIEQRARSLGLESRAFVATDAQTLQRALDAALEQRVGALLLSAEGLVLANRALIIDFAARKKLPVIYSAREFVDDGGLISYGADYPHLYYRAASYVEKILKGAKPGDLPIEQPTKLELVINMKTAHALGIKIPRDVLLRADQVIQ